MFIYIVKQWKTKKIVICLMMLGFLVGNLFLSVGTSMAVENYKIITDNNSGKLENQLELEFHGENKVTAEAIENIMESIGEFGEIQLISMPEIMTNRKSLCEVVLVNGKNIKGWHIPVIEGKYLRNSKKEVVIGKNIAKRFKKEAGDEITLGNKTFSIIGILGRENRDTIWDSVIYMDYKDYFECSDYESTVENTRGKVMTFWGLLKSGKKDFMNKFNDISELCSNNGLSVYYQELEGVSQSSFMNSVSITLISAGLIFVVAIINIVNLMYYWMIERRRDIAVMKAMGCTNKYLVKWLIAEMSAIALIGAALAVIIQMIARVCIVNVFPYNEISVDIAPVNILLALTVSVLSGAITALLIARKSLKFSPADVMACE